MFFEWVQFVCCEGLFVLEVSIEDVDDIFLKNGFSMVVDG